MRERGAALLAVLWLSVLLSFIALAFSSTTRTEVEATRNLVEGERGYFLARGALEAAVYALTSPPPPPNQAAAFRPGQREMNFEFETGTATVEVLPETGKLNVNQAPPAVLARLFANLGLPEQEAVELALAVDHWREPPSSRIPDALDRYYEEIWRRPAEHRPLESLEELLLVRGMTTELFYGSFVRTSTGAGRRPALADLLTVHNPGLAVDPNYADPVLLASLPGLDAESAANLVAARARRPFENMQEVMQNIPRILPGESLSYLALSSPRVFTLVAHGRAKGAPTPSRPNAGRVGDPGAELARSVRLVFATNPSKPLGYRLLEWSDRP